MLLSYAADPEPSDRIPAMLPFDGEQPQPEHSSDTPRVVGMAAYLPVEYKKEQSAPRSTAA